MLYEATRRGSELFHKNERRDMYYDWYFRDKDGVRWQDPDYFDDMERLILFLNQWSTSYENSPTSRGLLLTPTAR